MRPLTERQSEILQFIRDTLEATGFPPTRAEISRALGFASANAAEDHLRALARKGVIELTEGVARGIRLAEPPGLAVIGRVAAGQPILAEQHVQARYQIDPSLFSPRADYLLKVRGMSMRDVGILDGDLLAVHRTSEVRSGQIIVARLDNDVTVKRLRRQGSRVELLPENPDFEPIVVDLKEDPFEIEGLAVGVIRNGKLN
ncbi:MAG: transcriptional repressor LexA [Burkholderiales bacterium]|nr:transcriptional repressor LexA [Burkholderiales bacterium]